MITHRPAASNAPAGRRPAPRSLRILVVLFIGATLVACDAKSSRDATTIEAGARRYTEAILHGTANDVTDAISPTCTSHPTDAALAELREVVSARLGLAFTTLRIVSIETRNVTATTGEAWVRVNLRPELEGDDNWLSYAIDKGDWKLSDCGKLPFGGGGAPGPAAPTGPNGAGLSPTR